MLMIQQNKESFMFCYQTYHVFLAMGRAAVWEIGVWVSIKIAVKHMTSRLQMSLYWEFPWVP